MYQHNVNKNGTIALTSLEELDQFENWLLYPAASGASYFMSFLRDRHPHLIQKIIFFADKDPNKLHLVQEEKRIIPPEKINEANTDVIIICSPGNYYSILRDIRERYNLLLPVFLCDNIREYIAWESARSSLAQSASSFDDCDLNISKFSTFFQSLPFAKNAYPISCKGALTYRLLDQAQIPERLEGKSVLDLGASDAFYSLEAKARGADHVMAVESFYWEQGDGMEKFNYIKNHFGLDISHKILDVNEISYNDTGSYDVVFCLGLYYHLRDPFRFFRNIRKVTKEKLIVSGRTVRMPIFDPIHSDGKTASLCLMSDKKFGKWTANIHCLVDMLTIAGFEHVDVVFDLCPNGSIISSTALHAY